MRKYFLFLLGFLLSTSLPALATVQITSMSPDSAAPGDEITVTGGPFSNEIEVLLGEIRITPQAVSDRRLTFSLPELPPGQYLLRLAEQGRVSASPLLFRVTESEPRISSLQPVEVDVCDTDPPAQLTVEGQGFQSGSSLLIDGVTIGVEKISSDRITLTLPPLAPGTHQVQVANPAGSRSLPRGLLVNGTPVIFSTRIGADDVTTYALIIEGKNFLASSQLLVDGKRIPLVDRQPPGRESASLGDCRTIVYHRRPYSSQPKPITLKVINPGGRESAAVTIQAP
ncbi:IPT/TIG domain-containing protein [Desulfuromonas carbonis]|uniref:IPT/TIG domain-containing protein n=1 Tax=Desulfuromonas sp. DDH964 TaxID=1823759 RepID=UPI00078E22A9|nr:IPT/TIG domain-containing protein [Desulfuromonas sp. DDH964]AMV72552.1 IPT/TIG domain-containing protein [Desulfuromonas sp. DDH964]